MARMETRLADLGTVVFSANMHTIGFGQLEQKLARVPSIFWKFVAKASHKLFMFVGTVEKQKVNESLREKLLSYYREDICKLGFTLCLLFGIFLSEIELCNLVKLREIRRFQSCIVKIN